MRLNIVHNTFAHFNFVEPIYTLIKNFDYKDFKNYINIKNCINYICICVEIQILVFTTFIFFKKVICPLINWISKNFIFVKVLDIFLFHLSITFIFLFGLLYVYERKINISKKIILILFVLYNIIFFIGIFEKIYSDYSNRTNLSYLYYLDENSKKTFIFYKTNDMWLCSKKDYILCSKKETSEFYNKTLEYRNNLKNVNSDEIREKILDYIDKIDKYAGYIRINTNEVLDFLRILNSCIENLNIDLKKTELDELIDRISQITEVKLVDQNDIQKEKFYLYTDNKDKFYSLL